MIWKLSTGPGKLRPATNDAISFCVVLNAKIKPLDTLLGVSQMCFQV